MRPTEPADDTHNTGHGAVDCWCDPRFCYVCEECGGDGECWKCEDGTLPLSRDEAMAFPDPIIIVHREYE